jgi:hypothetical protein
VVALLAIRSAVLPVIVPQLRASAQLRRHSRQLLAQAAPHLKVRTDQAMTPHCFEDVPENHEHPITRTQILKALEL